MQAIMKGLEKVKQELAGSENDGPVSETFRKVLLMSILCLYFINSTDIYEVYHLYFMRQSSLSLLR